MSAVDKTRPTDGASAWTTPHGLVTVTAPAGVSPYYRLEWNPLDGGRRKQTTGTQTFAAAWRKAVKRESDLLAGATDTTEQPCKAGIAYWLDPTRPPVGKSKKPWGYSMRTSMSYYAKHYFTPVFGDLRHLDLRKKHIQKCVDMAPTESEGANVRKAAKNLIAAMRQGEYLPDSQVISLESVWWHGERAEADGETDEEEAGYVPKHKRPSNNQVRALREAAETTGRGVWWRGLMVELAAYSGPRFGELIALRDISIDAAQREVYISHRVAFERGRAPFLTVPKMAKLRTTVYPEVSPTGYDLADAMDRRLAEVAAEKAAGTNPHGLLFPARGGAFLRSGNFHRDIFEKAAEAAGWTYTDGTRANGKGKTRQQRSWDLTWHSLRHTFCTVALEEWKLADSVVATLAGHKSSITTRRLYVGSAENALAEARAATARQ